MNGILTLGSFFLSFLSFAVLLLLYWRTDRKLSYFRSLAENLVGIFDVSVEGEGEDAQLVLDPRLGAIIKGVSSQMAMSLKMSVLGSLSGHARLEKGLKGAMAQDFIEKKAPILNLVADILGINTAEYIQDHPEAIQQIVPLVQRFLDGQIMNSPQNQYDPFR